MKLRNKKTREVEDLNSILMTSIVKETNTATSEHVECTYYSLAELNEDWEDYKEPLIEDELIRRVIRTWASVNNISKVKFYAGWNSFRDGDIVIGFCFEFTDFDDLGDKKEYTIEELCGEE